MDKIRFKQAQELLKEAGQSKTGPEKMKTPREGTINSLTYAEIMKSIIETEEFIYSSRPTHKLLQEDAEEFCGRLVDIRNKIDDILVEFGVLEKEDVEEKVGKLSERFIILTSKGNFKKIITRWGVEPQRIVVAGVPLEAEDMRILNPKIPETALEPIKKKISHVKNDISRKMEQLGVQEILVVVENDKSGELLAKRAVDLYEAKVMKRDNLKDVDILEFRKILEG
ncbi:DUF2100 domain-containing protein [Methanobacterium formicicum]|uniref:DUF2100 domain-containing protein n=1 Tax=Methanobacterium formicicum TaxID=2162 RepID=A0A089ZHE9_METFO|nr:DUF2100 domain-containing protein [Methanobacterium formicicum]AIS31788.1 hypothetical protein BRM9_0971 [Methanobacterium formicicum]CEL25652.1 hypothetical protein MB9_2025 [Methanobacterium formicicum]